MFVALTLMCGAAGPTYWADVRPVLRAHCTGCHNDRTRADADKSGGLSLASPAGVAKTLTPGKPEQSSLVTRLTEKNLKRRMPLDADPLSAAEIETLRQWVAAGAPEGVKVEETSAGVNPAARPKRPITIPAKVPLTVAAGPPSPVTAVVFHGDTLAVGSYGRVTLFDVKTVAPRLTLPQPAAVHDVKFSPDGTRLAVAGGRPGVSGTVHIYDAATGAQRVALAGHTDVVAGVSFGPDGQLLASAGYDRTVRLWDTATGQLKHTFIGHSDFVYAVAFAPSGDWYATASKDRTARIVDAKTGLSKLTLGGADADVTAVAVRPDGAQVVTAGLEPQLVWWDAATGERLRRQAGHDLGVNEIAFDRGGTVAVSAGADRTARVWNARTGAAARTVAVGAVVYAVAADAAGKRLAVGSADGFARLYDAGSGKLLVTLWAGEPGWLAVTPDGHFAGTAPVAGPAALRDPAKVAAAVR